MQEKGRRMQFHQKEGPRNRRARKPTLFPSVAQSRFRGKSEDEEIEGSPSAQYVRVKDLPLRTTNKKLEAKRKESWANPFYSSKRGQGLDTKEQ